MAKLVVPQDLVSWATDLPVADRRPVQSRFPRHIEHLTGSIVRKDVGFWVEVLVDLPVVDHRHPRRSPMV